jgi:hypothetical protein
VILAQEGVTETRKTRTQHLEAAPVEFLKSVSSANQVQGSPAFSAGFGQYQRTGVEIERCKAVGFRDPRIGGPPAKASGDHQVHDQGQFVFQAKNNTFSDALKCMDFLAFNLGERRLDCAQNKWVPDTHARQGRAAEKGPQALYINDNIG